MSPGIVQGARGLMVSSVLLSFISIMVSMVGMKCTTCMSEQPEQKNKVALAGGVVFIIAGKDSETKKTQLPALLRGFL